MLASNVSSSIPLSPTVLTVEQVTELDWEMAEQYTTLGVARSSEDMRSTSMYLCGYTNNQDVCFKMFILGLSIFLLDS